MGTAAVVFPPRVPKSEKHEYQAEGGRGTTEEECDGFGRLGHGGCPDAFSYHSSRSNIGQSRGPGNNASCYEDLEFICSVPDQAKRTKIPS